MLSRALLIGSILAALSTCAHAGNAGGSIGGSSDPKKICQAYAKTAVSQYWYAVYNCPNRMKDLRWHPNYKQHYNWCMIGSNRGQPASNETNERYWILDKCKPGSGGPIIAP